MKKQSIFAAIMAATLSLTGCTTGNIFGTPSATDAVGSVADAGSSILNGLLGSLLSTTLSESSLYGTWTYKAPECRFESESLLAKAGGEVAAAKIEKTLDSYLSKVGIGKGITTYTFNQDKTFAIVTKGKTISTGTWTFDAQSKQLQMKGTLGLLNQTCTVGMDGTNLCLLYEADKLLSVANSVGSTLGKLSGNSTLSTVTSLLGSNYKGMKLGFQLSK